MSAQTVGAAQRHRILIVDDEESTRLLLAHQLTRALRAETPLAGTCEEALRLAGNYAYDAILLDLMMPGIGGVEVLKDIRAASPNTQTPVVVVTMLADRESIDACLHAGADGYLVKPVDSKVLVATVTAQLQARRSTRRVAAPGAAA